MRQLLLFLGILFFTFSVLAADNKVTVHVALTPAGSFQAESTKLKGKLSKKGDTLVADKISVSVESFKTGIDLRDEHFWKHLNPTKKHPRIVLTNLKTSGRQGSGVLEVNGVKQPVKFNFVEKDGMAESKFKLKASSFNLSKASYMGVGVADEVLVHVRMKLK